MTGFAANGADFKRGIVHKLGAEGCVPVWKNGWERDSTVHVRQAHFVSFCLLRFGEGTTSSSPEEESSLELTKPRLVASR